MFDHDYCSYMFKICSMDPFVGQRDAQQLDVIPTTQGNIPPLYVQQNFKEYNRIQEIYNYEHLIFCLQNKISKLIAQNENLKTHLKPKRHYSKRRINLQKCFNCPMQNCQQSYSSKIALRNHLNKKHKQNIKCKQQ